MKKQKRKDTNNGSLFIVILLGIILGIIRATSDGDKDLTVIIISIITIVACFAIGIAGALLINAIKKKKQRKQMSAQPEVVYEPLGTEKLDIIIEEIKKRSAKPALRINAEKCDVLGIAQSKFGGYPYWEEGDAYPLDSEGKPMFLLAQINFAEMEEANPLLPQKGLLQFFIADDVYSGANFGAEYDDLAEQKNFRVVYHADIDSTVTEESVKAQGIKAFCDDSDNDYFPLTTQEKITFTEFADYMYFGMDECDRLVEKILREEFGEEIESDMLYKRFDDSEYEYVSDAFKGCWCSKMLGYPEFTQSDYRAAEDGDDNYEYYDTVLLQIDSDDEIMWGDCGIANFLINSEALKKLDFSNVSYHWDCY